MPDHANSVTETAPDSAYEGRESPEPGGPDARPGRGPATGGAAESPAHAPDPLRHDRELEGGGASEERD